VDVQALAAWRADIIVVKDGQFIGMEVKRLRTHQSHQQKGFECDVKAAGGHYHVVRSIEDVAALGL
jgi:hypothetical protein